MANNQKLAYCLVKERFADTPLSSEGARRYGGRWNPPGAGILSTSASPELALLEQLVHLPALAYEDLPKLFLVTLGLPQAPAITSDLPDNWREPAKYYHNHLFLKNWLDKPEIMSIGAPSAVVAESYNFLLHPLHQDFKNIKILSSHPFNIDPRLWNMRNAKLLTSINIYNSEITSVRAHGQDKSDVEPNNQYEGHDKMPKDIAPN